MKHPCLSTGVAEHLPLNNALQSLTVILFWNKLSYPCLELSDNFLEMFRILDAALSLSEYFAEQAWGLNQSESFRFQGMWYGIEM